MTADLFLRWGLRPQTPYWLTRSTCLQRNGTQASLGSFRQARALTARSALLDLRF